MIIAIDVSLMATHHPTPCAQGVGRIRLG